MEANDPPLSFAITMYSTFRPAKPGKMRVPAGTGIFTWLPEPLLPYFFRLSVETKAVFHPGVRAMTWSFTLEIKIVLFVHAHKVIAASRSIVAICSMLSSILLLLEQWKEIPSRRFRPGKVQLILLLFVPVIVVHEKHIVCPINTVAPSAVYRVLKFNR